MILVGDTILVSKLRSTLMENLNIAVVSNDKDYARTMGLAVINVCRTIVINVFTEEEFATETDNESAALEAGRVFDGFDVVLYDSNDTRAIDRNKHSVIYLVDKPSLACRKLSQGLFCVFKYIPAQRMVSEIFEIYGQITGRRPPSLISSGVPIYAFTSWAGGTGCTTMALSFAQELTRFHDKRVMYISLEELESTSEYFPVHGGVRTLGFYLYNLFRDKYSQGLVTGSEEAEFRPFMESYVIKDDFGIEAFLPTKGRNPLIDLSPNDMCVFMESLINTGRYDVIVVDAGRSLSPAAMASMEMAERICVVGNDQMNAARENHMMQYLLCVAGDDMERKALKIINKLDNNPLRDFLNGEGEREDTLLKTSLEIEKDTITILEDNVTKILIQGSFGQKINTLTEMLTTPLK